MKAIPPPSRERDGDGIRQVEKTQSRHRRRVRRFKKIGKTLQRLFSPNLEKALTFLDDELLPSTSNAVERGYRRHRKMQKTVSRVRTHSNITGRIALDMHREERSKQQKQTTHALHASRSRDLERPHDRL